MTRFLLVYLKHNKLERGFTLVELLISAIIIGILSAIAIPAFINSSNRAREAEADIYLKAVNTQQQLHFIENGVFATTFQQLGNIIEPETDNYSYSITEVSPTSATTEASPKQLTVSGAAARQFLVDGAIRTFICKGEPGSVPPVGEITSSDDPNCSN